MKTITEYRKNSDGKAEIDLYCSNLGDGEVDEIIKRLAALDAEINYADCDSLDATIKGTDQTALEGLLKDGWSFGGDVPRCLCDICKMECDARDGPEPIEYEKIEDPCQQFDRD